MRIRKEAVREGTFAYRDKSGKQQLLTATPELIKYWGESGNAMRAAGHPIPVPLEHDSSAHPMTPAERLRNNVGEVDHYELGTVDEVMPDGTKVTKTALFSVADIKDEQVKGKIKDGTINWTSPAFDSFTDSTGKRWEGVITHLALTSRPAFTKQEPFQAQFSLAPTTPTSSNPPSGVCLSRAGMVREASPGLFKPVYPVAFSLWSGSKFALEDMEEGKKKGKDDGEKAPKKEGKEKGEEGSEKEGEKPFGGKGGEEEGPKHKFDPMTGEQIKEALVDPDGDISIWCVLADMLSMALGVEIGEDELSEEDGPQKLYEMLRDALKAKNAGAQQSPPEEPTPEPAAGGGNRTPNPIIQEQQPVYMSLTMTAEEANKIADPAMRNIALQLAAAQVKIAEGDKKAEATKQNIFRKAGEARQKRVNDAARFMPEAQRAGFLKSLEGAQFSLQDDGTVVDSAEPVLAAVEAVVQGLPALLKGQMNGVKFSVVDQPRETTDTSAIPPERMKEVAAEFNRNAGIKASA